MMCEQVGNNEAEEIKLHPEWFLSGWISEMKSSIRISNGGNTIHATGDAANDLFKAMTEPIKKEARHMHVNNGMNDACKECGKDLRNEIHFRVGEH